MTKNSDGLERRAGWFGLVAVLLFGSATDAFASKQVLFGDLHVHTTYSIDSYVFALPLFGGEGAHPPADACDFARHCAGLDFFSLNDHAEGLTPERWRDTKDAVRQCNALSGDAEDPEMVAFTGWEWTQVGTGPENHYGHKNVIFPGTADSELPLRPISSLADDVMDRAPSAWVLGGAQAVVGLFSEPYGNFLGWIERLAEIPNCEKGVHSRELPEECRENAATPGELFRKLDEWALPSLVIPHGTAWGVHTPRGTDIAVQLSARDHDPERQRLFEVYSGHGNSEEFRSFGAATRDGEFTCPETTAEFYPCCQRAGELMRARCGDLPEDECRARVEEAKRFAAAAPVKPQWVFPDTRPEDWLDCDQCRDCFKPAMSLRPRQSAQYSLALTNFEPGDAPRRFRFGLMASSDNHTARPGTGYKQVARREMTDSRGARSSFIERGLARYVNGEQLDDRRAQEVPVGPIGFRGLLSVERVASFMYPGGLVGVHAEGRDRHSIWDSLVRREVFGTSGPRILLWFDLTNGPQGVAPMGSAVEMDRSPVFRVRAVGAPVQIAGCPAQSQRGLGADRVEKLCRGECYRPSNTRHRIEAIEIVRIRPQVEAGEPVADLIEDPWRRILCEPDPSGCAIEFVDESFTRGTRDAVYYVRAIQEETPAINAANLRTEFDAKGRATRVTPCHGGYRTSADDDCLAATRERAWSSPIFVDYDGRAQADVAQLEALRRRAFVDRDLAVLGRLLHERLVYIHSNGNPDSKQSLMEGLRSGKVRYLAFKGEEPRVEVAGDAAKVVGRVRMTVQAGSETLDLDSTYYAIYDRSEGPWQLVAYQSQPAQAGRP